MTPAPSNPVLDVYLDYKSPYAYLALGPTRALAARHGLILNWLPYTLDIASYLGSARVDAEGRVLEEQRNAHQWRRVRYAYMDCRREAKRQGLVIRGTQKIWDTVPVHVALLYVKAQHPPYGGALLERFHDLVYPRFWQRALDVEALPVLEALLRELGLDANPFQDYLADEGRRAQQQEQQRAQQRGVFGVPSYYIGGQLYWGQERLARVEADLDQHPAT